MLEWLLDFINAFKKAWKEANVHPGLTPTERLDLLIRWESELQAATMNHNASHSA